MQRRWFVISEDGNIMHDRRAPGAQRYFDTFTEADACAQRIANMAFVTSVGVYELTSAYRPVRNFEPVKVG